LEMPPPRRADPPSLVRSYRILVFLAIPRCISFFPFTLPYLLFTGMTPPLFCCLGICPLPFPKEAIPPFDSPHCISEHGRRFSFSLASMSVCYFVDSPLFYSALERVRSSFFFYCAGGKAPFFVSPDGPNPLSPRPPTTDFYAPVYAAVSHQHFFFQDPETTLPLPSSFPLLRVGQQNGISPL